ncbi:MAG TPA: NAD(P)/FAD-dependent oxidoreductase [Casimicrobiaceae bacterium]|nr:NAD(P)/FAD-dependent oxidoreductase [Casimicrobiaceae bacterium]
MQRREFLKVLAATSSAAIASGCATMTREPSIGKVVVVGGGYGGATTAKYVRMWSGGRIDVTLVEANPAFVSCPMSNLVLGGSKTIADMTVPYDGLTRQHGIRVVRDTASAVDVDKKVVRLESGGELPYDRLILSPGIDFMFESVPGYNNADAQREIFHAWKAGPQTVALRRQLEAMRDGGVYAITIPVAPYRCPPGPYERACQVAWYFKNAKPKSKVLILDGNPDVTSKAALFKRAWSELYQGIVEYRPNHVMTDVDWKTKTAKFETANDVKADVLNALPPQRAGNIARQAGVITANNRWCEVDFLTFESIKVKNIHVLGDAIQIAPAMPKSGHMANSHAKVCAAAVVALITGQPVNPAPVVNNTCYSFITDRDVVHVASVHQYDRDKKTYIAVQGAGGLSQTWTPLEGEYAFAWAANIWADSLA